MVRLTRLTWLRSDPVSGGENPNSFSYYPSGALFIIIQEDDPHLRYHNVLSPDGRMGWIFKSNLEVVDETG